MALAMINCDGNDNGNGSVINEDSDCNGYENGNENGNCNGVKNSISTYNNINGNTNRNDNSNLGEEF